MDQLKEFLRQAAKHRFWIAIGVASLLPLIAIFVGVGGMIEQEATESAKIKGADEGAKKYISKTIENKQWKDVVEERTEIVAKDVSRSHEKLYNRQAPLLTWPEAVAENFKAWGPKHPAGIDPAKIDDIVLTYTQKYPDYVDAVYASFNPFDPETGVGVVAAPSVPTLLLPEVFREDKLPTLNEVWMAQRRLWIQGTMLDVIAKVNAKAKTWDQAPVKQILWMEIATEAALDQRTAAAGDQLEDAPEILAPGQTAASATEKPAAVAGLGLGAGAASSSAGMKFVKSSNPDQYYVVPVAMGLYVEQDKLPDLLVAFRNSPMSIVIKDFKWTIPAKPIIKPRKGLTATVFDNASGGAARSRGGLQGGEQGLDMGGGQEMSLENMNSASSAYNKAAMGSRGMGQGFGSKGNAKSKARETSTDIKSDTLKKLQEKRKGTGKANEKTDEDEDEPTSSNPYFNVVQVTIRGQARFYQAPPKSAEPAKAESPQGDAPTETSKAEDEKAKAEQAKAVPKAEDDTAKDAPNAGEEKAKAEPANDAPKAAVDPAMDAPKSDASKAEDEKAKAEPAKAAPKAADDKPKG